MFSAGSPQYGECAAAKGGRPPRAQALPRLRKLDAALAKVRASGSKVSSSLNGFFDASAVDAEVEDAAPIQAAAPVGIPPKTPTLEAPEKSFNVSSSLIAPPTPSLPDAPKPRVRKGRPDYFYRTLLPASWAATGLDAYTTATVLGRGGYEMDPLYTSFGSKNEKGVITSMIVGQALVTTAALLLHRAGKKHRILRWLSDGLLAYKTEANIQGATHNFLLLSHWPSNSPANIRPVNGPR
ncbi:MAG TPA: hypothetical protein VNK24_08480 [Elusimicrobiota bacterium]|nr:hypothetical protein [Elusimicrobiota bacterium]